MYLEGENEQGFPKVWEINRLVAAWAMHKCDNNKTLAARKLCISRQTLRTWLNCPPKGRGVTTTEGGTKLEDPPTGS